MCYVVLAAAALLSDVSKSLLRISPSELRAITKLNGKSFLKAQKLNSLSDRILASEKNVKN